MKYFLWFLFIGNIAAYAQQTIKDLTVQDLKVVSTVKGSKPCPLMTSTQRDAIASPLNGQCIYNTTTSKINTYNGSTWKQVSDIVVLTTDVSGILPIANGGTASSTRPFVDLSSSETIGGSKTFSSTIIGSVNGNAATVTTNANLSGPITSSGNTTSVASQTGTGSTFVMNTSPILVTPTLGSASGTALTLSTPLSVPSGGTGLNSLTASNVILGNGTSTPNFVAPGTSGNVLTSNGTTWTSSAAASGGNVSVVSGSSSYALFSFSYGTTNASTRCTASPCSYLDQIGSEVSSVTRSTTGTMAAALARTYTKLKCTGNCQSAGVAGNCLIVPAPRCESCNSVPILSVNAATEGAMDSSGTITCIGEY